MFGSLKKKLSKRGCNPLTPKSNETANSPTQGAMLAPSNNANSALTYPSAATRRPSGSSNPFTRSGANDPPPSYTPGPANSGAISYQVPIVATTDNDKYAFLRTFDTIFLIDDSSSMAGGPWREVADALGTIAPLCAERDQDGVDVWFLNDKRVFKNLRTVNAIREVFTLAEPRGQTFTGQRLYQMLDPYLAEYKKNPDSTKPVNIIVITDGEAHDDVGSTIRTAAKKLDKWDAPPWQVGIQFFQIGRDVPARKVLQDLDNGLSQDGVRDIVDTVPFKDESGHDLSEKGIMKVVLGSVNRRLDRNSKDLHRS